MSRPKRRSLSESLNAPEVPSAASEPSPGSPETATVESHSAVTPSRDSLPQTNPEDSLEVGQSVTPSRDNAAPVAVESGRGGARRRSPGDQTRHSYHASLYLPEEAQFALREIALVTRRPKPHDVMLEAMADLFERYNKSELAAECRRRITSRDKAKA